MTAREPTAGVDLDANVPHSARMWDYWLGGKDNFASDRAACDAVAATCPQIVEVAKQSRKFLQRAVRYLAAEAGIRQFLDLGTGLPAADNTHAVAQAVAPACRIVYVDNDPMVLSHARALLLSHPAGVTDYIAADVRHTGILVEKAARTLDFGQPIAVLLLGVLGSIADTGEAVAVVRQLIAALPPGSYVVINDLVETPGTLLAVQAAREKNATYRPHTLAQLAGFFDGLHLIAPGIVSTPLWRPDDAKPPRLDVVCGVARKAGWDL